MAAMKPLWGLLLLVSWTTTASEVFSPSDVPLLDNRFRIDNGVRAITFIIKHKPGTPSVILVRPDGSKLYADRATVPEVGWLALPEWDLITLRDPMPGPWQAIGEVDPDNRVRLLSDVRLKSELLPTPLYQGERLKLASRLLFDGAAQQGYYLSDLGMTVSLQSLEEGGPTEVRLGHYLDDGKGLDEAPGDGVMTAEAVLDVPPGEYRAHYSTANQVFARASSQEVQVRPSPVSYTLTAPSHEHGARLAFLIDGKILEPASVVIQAKITDGRGEGSLFSAVATGQSVGIELASIKAVGQYEVQATLFGTTRSGREIQLRMPAKAFSILPQAPALPQVTPVAKEEAPPGWLTWAWGGVGVSLLLLGAGGAILRKKWRALHEAVAAHKTQSAEAMKLDLNLPEQ